MSLLPSSWWLGQVSGLGGGESDVGWVGEDRRRGGVGWVGGRVQWWHESVSGCPRSQWNCGKDFRGVLKVLLERFCARTGARNEILRRGVNVLPQLGEPVVGVGRDCRPRWKDDDGPDRGDVRENGAETCSPRESGLRRAEGRRKSCDLEEPTVEPLCTFLRVKLNAGTGVAQGSLRHSGGDFTAPWDAHEDG